MVRATRFNPARTLVLGFLSLIIIGAVLLSLPIATIEAGRLPLLDALFTATSAVCVTGLVVVDTGTTFTVFGQTVIMLLIQAGGLGFMTSATLIFLALGRKITLRERIVIQESLNQFDLQGVVRLVRSILILAFSIQGIATMILGIRFSQELGWAKGFFFGLFHSISAFCNAGFDLIGDFRSLMPYVNDPLISLLLPLLFIIGGLGFTVLVDLYFTRYITRLGFHTKVALIITGSFLLIGFLTVTLLEWNNPKTLGSVTGGAKIWSAFFTAATPRTAGFNVLPTDELNQATTLFIMVLMFIGASPASTGGGIKTTTFGTLLLAVISVVKGKNQVSFLRKRIPYNLISKALAIIFISLGIVVLVAMVLLVTEDANFEEALFEAISAFGTVGLSKGITPDLSAVGRIVVIVTMFVGRVGPLTLAFALAKESDDTGIKYPEERLLIG
ncbi:TrkH family potassium uptake protein [Natranaerobius thermophilus]|uniref:Potassium uptake protein, TrkH family n=1 Tax=Natranaerobius thermophilus (strain ATCC BAA-1301 / DSM 18059 / JW/NM-WN-LF) TaxID=457570 RepID=B2A3S6_NATTJ|nr:TrkH family potassium uptake protein [Natranaerobius thermophilus]ACB83702.1 potassium uptake protein, TrkH family [Natranaerobius thermophilus JW/NM-WN-LF]